MYGLRANYFRQTTIMLLNLKIQRDKISTLGVFSPKWRQFIIGFDSVVINSMYVMEGVLGERLVRMDNIN